MPFIRPKKKLKALHWEKVDEPQVTVWAAHAPTHEEKEAKYVELSRKGVLDEVEKLFMAKEIKLLGANKPKQSDKKQLISRDLMHTFGISMAKFSQQSAEEVVRKIIHCDRDVLDSAVVLEFLQKDDFCVVPDNLAKLMAPYSKDWSGVDPKNTQREQDPAELTREDQIYLMTAYELRHYWKSRMRALALTRSYEPDYDEISQNLKEVVNVSESLRDSVSLMNVLGLILDIGNYMNDANKQASGFKLSSLARLGMIKDDKNETTFADLVERIVRKQYPEWEHFVDDISGVVKAKKLNVEQLGVDAKKYIDNIKNVQSSLDAGNLSDPKRFHPEDRFAVIVTRSMREARRKAEQMQLYLDEMNRTYDDIMVFYGEDSSDENARRDFFGKLASFVTEWKKSKEKNIVLEESRRRTEASIARKRAANQAAAASSTVNADGSLQSPQSTGAMDSLLEKLRAAGPQNRDQRDRRRRARLKDRHQNRIASGQKMPELSELTRDPDEKDSAEPGAMLSPDSIAEGSEKPDVSEGEDVADRAASLLQGLRGGEDNEGDLAGNLRVRRRRENADEERRARRRRRAAASTDTSEGLGAVSGEGAILEQEDGEHSPIKDSGMSGEHEGVEAPATREVIVPTAAAAVERETGTQDDPLEISD